MAMLVEGGVLAALAAIAVLLIARPSGPRPPRARSPYAARPLLTPWERRALLSFRGQLPTGFYVCPQVRLADMLDIADGSSEGRGAALRRVASKSVDFAIIRLETGRVELVVELDDRSHQRDDRRARDRLVGEVLEAGGIPLVRFRPSDRLDVRRFFPIGSASTSRDL